MKSNDNSDIINYPDRSPAILLSLFFLKLLCSATRLIKLSYGGMNDFVATVLEEAARRVAQTSQHGSGAPPGLHRDSGRSLQPSGDNSGVEQGPGGPDICHQRDAPFLLFHPQGN